MATNPLRADFKRSLQILNIQPLGHDLREQFKYGPGRQKPVIENRQQDSWEESRGQNRASLFKDG